MLLNDHHYVHRMLTKCELNDSTLRTFIEKRQQKWKSHHRQFLNVYNY